MKLFTMANHTLSSKMYQSDEEAATYKFQLQDTVQLVIQTIIYMLTHQNCLYMSLLLA